MLSTVINSNIDLSNHGGFVYDVSRFCVNPNIQKIHIMPQHRFTNSPLSKVLILERSILMNMCIIYRKYGILSNISQENLIEIQR